VAAWEETAAGRRRLWKAASGVLGADPSVGRWPVGGRGAPLDTSSAEVPAWGA
jgi:hypothetical protein